MTYPNIEDTIVSMAACNGALNRTTTSKQVITRCMGSLQADGVPTEDVIKLEAWLGTLTEEQKLTLVDGEHQEQAAIVATSPRSVTDEGWVGDLLEDAWEAL